MKVGISCASGAKSKVNSGMREVMKSLFFSCWKKMLSLNSSEKENVKRLAKPASARGVKATPNTRHNNRGKSCKDLTADECGVRPGYLNNLTKCNALRVFNRRFTPTSNSKELSA